MNLIKLNDITEFVPTPMYWCDVAYSEPPLSSSDEIYKVLNEIGVGRRTLGRPSYFIVNKEGVKLFDCDSSSKIRYKLGPVDTEAYLVQFGTVYKRIRDNKQLTTILANEYDRVCDPCAGTGRAVEKFKEVYVYDKDPNCIELLRSKYGNLVSNNEKEEN